MSENTNKLNRLKSMIKRLHSFNRNATGSDPRPEPQSKPVPEQPGYHPVYVGKSRRRYLISSELIDDPLFQNLLERSGDDGSSSPAVIIGCEVVLFEHLLWMLQNADPKPDSLDELVEFYSC